MCKKKEELESKQGVCPKCGGALEYGSSEPTDDMVSYEVDCSECDWDGDEWYVLEFSGHSE